MTSDAPPDGTGAAGGSGAQPLVKAGRHPGALKAKGERGAAVADVSMPGREGGKPALVSTIQYAQALVLRRRRRRLRVAAWFTLVVVVPVLAATAYSFLLATPRYTSEMEITYQTYRTPSSLASGLVQSVTGTSQQNTVDLGTICYEYIRSSALAEKLDASLHLRKAFSSPKIDWWSRLPADALRERYLAYFRDHVRPSEGLGGYLVVDVDAFTPQLAQELAKAVFAATDDMVDRMTERARTNAVQFAQAELTRQEARLRKARTDLTTFQDVHGDQDPDRAASQLGSIVGSLESELASTQALLETTKTTLAPQSPIVTQLKLKIESLKQQLKNEKLRLASQAPKQQPYSKVLEEYSRLQQEQEFAKNAYNAAQQGLVLARAGADARQNYVVDFAPPNLPERMDYSIPLIRIGTVLLVALLVFGLGSLVKG